MIRLLRPFDEFTSSTWFVARLDRMSLRCRDALGAGCYSQNLVLSDDVLVGAERYVRASLSRFRSDEAQGKA